MKARLVQISCVVVGKSHNPTILNPDFLAVQGIVPREWGWKVLRTITTPVLATVAYDGGLSITVEPNKIQVVDLAPPDEPVRSKAPQVAVSYVHTLPHVRYTAVGTNFQTLVGGLPGAPEAYLRDRFIVKEVLTAGRQPVGAGVRLLYDIEEATRLTLSLDAGGAAFPEAPDKKEEVVIVNANFHRACSTYPSEKEVEAHLGRFGAPEFDTFRP